MKCPESIKKATLGLEVTINYSESLLGGTTHKISKFGRINQHNASAVSDSRRNGYWKRYVGLEDKQKKGVSTNAILLNRTVNTLTLSSFA